MKKSVEEIRKLNQEISAARQDNLALKVLIKVLEQTLYLIYNKQSFGFPCFHTCISKFYLPLFIVGKNSSA